MARVLVCTVGFRPELVLGGLPDRVARAILITQDQDDVAAEQVEQARQLLRGKGIESTVERCNLFDPVDCYRKLDEIFEREIQHSDGIDFNVGLGSPVLTTVGAMVAGFHKQRVYGFAWRGEPPAQIENLKPIELSLPTVHNISQDQIVLLNHLVAIGGRANVRSLKKFLDANSRPSIPHLPDADGRYPAANVRVLLDRMAQDGYAHWCPSPSGRRDDKELELVDLGRTVQRMVGHRVPPSAVNLSLATNARPRQRGRPRRR